MNIKFKGNVTLTPALSNYIETKLISKLEPFDAYITSIIVNLRVEKNIHVIEVLTHVKERKNNRINKVKITNQDMYTAIDLVSDKVVRQVRKFKEKVKGIDHEPASLLQFPISYENEKENYEIKKIKKFDLEPMFVEDAIEKMNELNHQFFFYFDASEQTPCVVYLRNDGSYGILES